MFDPWKVLGLEPTHDAIAIKKAYARRLKTTRPDDDAEGYQRLRSAYEMALHLARMGAHLAAAPVPHEVEEPALAETAESDDAFAAADAHPREQRVPVREAMHAPRKQPDEDDESMPVREAVYAPLAPPQEDDESMPVREAVYAPLAPPQDDDGPVPVREAAYVSAEESDAEDDGEEPLHPHDALLAVVAHAERLTTQEFTRQWPQLEQVLDSLPLALRAEASLRIAQLVLARHAIDARTLARIAGYFSWSTDYQADEALGPDLAQRIRSRLREQGARRQLDARTRHRFAVPLQVDRLLEEGRDNTAALFAALAPPKFGDRLREAGPGELRGLGMGLGGVAPEDLLAARTMSATFGLAAGFRLVFFALLLAGLLHVFFEASKVGAIASGTLIALGSAGVAIGVRRLREMLDPWVARVKVRGRYRALGVLLALGGGAWLSTTRLVDGNPIVIAVAYAVLALLLAWDVRVRWRAMLLPATVAAILACAPWFGEERLHFAVLTGTAWTLAIHAAALRSLDTTLAFYRAPWVVFPSTVGRWILFIVFIKGVALFFAAALAVTMPLSYLVLALFHGVAFSVAALALAATLAWMQPADAQAGTIAWFIAAPFALVVLQWAATKLSRSRVFRPRS